MQLPPRESIANHVRILQVIVAALTVGCLTFAPIAISMSRAHDPAEGEQDLRIVTSMALALGAFALVTQFVISPMLHKQTRQNLVQQEGAGPDDALRLLTGFQTSTIVTAAFAEGACLFNLIAYMIEGSPYTLAMAAVLVLTIAVRFPTLNGVVDWLEREIRRVKEEREMGRP